MGRCLVLSRGEILGYDASLGMYRQSFEFSLDRLRFYRFLAENNRLEHPVHSAPEGIFSLACELEEERLGR